MKILSTQKPGWITDVWLAAAEAGWITDFLGGVLDEGADPGVVSALTAASVAAR